MKAKDLLNQLVEDSPQGTVGVDNRSYMMAAPIALLATSAVMSAPVGTSAMKSEAADSAASKA